ncbi:MAG: N-acyl homoserine lactonase family protein [Alphaproteobacteria bacterium]|nr:N-acyl homoserine lactonase family protein [Alphaproteobacteria bacterium]
MTEPHVHEVFAIKYAAMPDRAPWMNFIGIDPHEGPSGLDFYVWLIRGGGRTWVVDIGYDRPVAERRGRSIIRNPVEGLQLMGVDAAAVEDVVITHMHWDHVGNVGLFPKARIHVQDKEMQYTTGRYMQHAAFRAAYDLDHVLSMVTALYGNRLVFHDGDDELAPGLSVHFIGGHTMGLQVVRVWTRRGWVVLASDASHLYPNMELGRPFPIVFNVGEMLEGHKKLQRLASSGRHVIPGHDPDVMRRYPAVSKELEGIAVRLDVEPTA